MDFAAASRYAPKPIPIPAPAQVERQRQVEILSGEMAGDISWSGASMGSWIRDDVVMTGTSPYPDQSPSCWRIEAEFLRNFICCGIILDTHHDLAKHREEIHGGEAANKGATMGFGQVRGFHREDCPAPPQKPVEVDPTKSFSFSGLPVLLKKERLSMENVLKHEKSTSTSHFVGVSRDVKSARVGPSGEHIDENAPIFDSGGQFIDDNPVDQDNDQKAPTKLRSFSDQEWENCKETFERLYVVEDRPLRQVAKIMKDDFGFNATEKQYKNRIATWGLEKNVKQREMKAIVRKKQQRKIVDNKESAFRVRGRDVEANKIHRFIKRQETKNMGAIPVTSPADSTPSAISCYTPRQFGPSSPNESVSPPSRPLTTPLSEISLNSLPRRDSTNDAQENYVDHHHTFMSGSFSKIIPDAPPRRGSMTPVSSPTTMTGFHGKFPDGTTTTTSTTSTTNVPGHLGGYGRSTVPAMQFAYRPMNTFSSDQGTETDDSIMVSWQVSEYKVW